MELFLLQHLAEMFCTIGRVLNNLPLQQVGSSLWNLVAAEKERRLGAAASLEVGYPPALAVASAIAAPSAQPTPPQLPREDLIKTVSLSSLDAKRAGIANNMVKPPEERSDRISMFLNSKVYRDIMAHAVALEPKIGAPYDTRRVLMAPYHDPRFVILNHLQGLLPVGQVDAIICVPWIRAGGADLVACLLAGAIQELKPDERVLILRLDQPHFEREDWVPEGVETLDLSAPLSLVAPDQADELLYQLLMGINPKRVINVNSRRCWTTFERYGSRLATQMKLYAYLFCWDYAPSGVRAGYPSDFFPTVAPKLHGVFVDSRFLRDELMETYSAPKGIGDLITVLHSPARFGPSERLSAEVGARTAPLRNRPKILWAGRLDRQKRFDLVILIARAMPDVDFACWGEALLDRPPDHSTLPSNLSLYKNFVSYEELPLDNSDAWLFTSDWEGMPTLLIELAMRGVAIVASAVGGVPELIDETTGFPIPPGSGHEVYVEAVRMALRLPEQRIERARRLQQRVIKEYSRQGYVAQLDAALRNAEDVRAEQENMSLEVLA